MMKTRFLYLLAVVFALTAALPGYAKPTKEDRRQRIEKRHERREHRRDMRQDHRQDRRHHRMMMRHDRRMFRDHMMHERFRHEMRMHPKFRNDFHSKPYPMKRGNYKHRRAC